MTPRRLSGYHREGMQLSGNQITRCTLNDGGEWFSNSPSAPSDSLVNAYLHAHDQPTNEQALDLQFIQSFQDA